MSEELTPRTDAVIANDAGDSSYISNLAKIARTLERELNAVRAELADAKGMATIAIKRCGALTSERDQLRATNFGLLEALQEGTEDYCQLANSGDAGFWDPEEVEWVKKARAAIAGAKEKPVTEGIV